MKKLFLFATALFAAMTINATDIWTGEKHISWEDGGIQIEAAQFADAVAGQKLVVSFTGASDGIEFKVLNDFHYLPGTHNQQWISGDGNYNLALTEAAVADLKAFGLEIIGANFTITNVAIEEGDAFKEGGLTIWKGYFWIEDWNTMELFLAGWSIDWSLYDKMVVYHEAGFDTYFMKVLSKFDNDDAIISQTATKYTDRFEIDLTAVDVANIYADEATTSDRLLVQGNPEDGSAFNLTDIVLVPKNETAVENVGIEAKAVKAIVNGQVVIIRDNKTFNLLGTQILEKN
ncbi:MAG: hypothetical protein IJS82_06665 [Paludibacteraceae bacterium]|nr:hypothetical protein [Paludibacteraceae bacterium]